MIPETENPLSFGSYTLYKLANTQLFGSKGGIMGGGS